MLSEEEFHAKLVRGAEEFTAPIRFDWKQIFSELWKGFKQSFKKVK